MLNGDADAETGSCRIQNLSELNFGIYRRTWTGFSVSSTWKRSARRPLNPKRKRKDEQTEKSEKM
jgi:hypothetical protein